MAVSAFRQVEDGREEMTEDERPRAGTESGDAPRGSEALERENEVLREELATARAERDRARMLTDAAFEAVCLHVDGRFVVDGGFSVSAG